MAAMKTVTTFSLFRLRSAFVLVALALVQEAQAVSPSPDGGDAGGNTGEGQNVLLSLTTGTNNMAVGLFSLSLLKEGKLQTALGAGSLLTFRRIQPLTPARF